MNLIKTLGNLALFVVSWFSIFFVVTIITELTLAPWDTALHRPEVGTWQRSLNDFFETAPGYYAISIPLTMICIILTLVTLRQNPRAQSRMLLIHLVFAPVLFTAWMLAAMVNNVVYPYPPVLYDPNYPGYYRSVIPLAAVIVMCALWFYAQIRLAKSGRPAMLIG